MVDEARSGLEVPVQHEGIEVGSVRPHDGAQLVVHAHLRKEARVGQWLEHRTAQLSGEIDLPETAVAEAELKPIVTKHLDRRDGYELHRLILRQGVDRLGSAAATRALPVCLQLLPMQAGPLGHELERTTRKTAHEHGTAANLNHRMMLGVLSVEVGRIVVIEVHRDDDPVEEADAGHAAIMSACADGEGAGISTPTGRFGGRAEAAKTTTARRQRRSRAHVTNRAHIAPQSRFTAKSALSPVCP